MEEGAFVSKVALPRMKSLRNIPEGEIGFGEIFFTSGGDVFAWLEYKSNQGDQKLWRKDGVWYGELVRPIGRSQLTGYSKVPEHKGAVPVMLSANYSFESGFDGTE